MKSLFSFVTALLVTASAALASPFTIAEENGKMTASWTGDAAEVVEDAPTDEDLAGLAEHPEIEVIDLKGCTNLTGTGFAALKDLPNLRTIRFNGSGPERFSALFNGNLEGFKALAELKQVTELSFGHVMVPVEGTVAILEGMESLENFGAGTFADDRTIAAAASAPRLKSLGFGHWKALPEASVTLEGFSKYAGMSNLESLGTGTLPPSDGTTRDILEVLSKLKSLQSLKLAFGGKGVKAEKTERPPFSPITPEDMEVLTQLTELQLLGLNEIEVADGALVKLATLPKLSRLEIKNAKVSETDVEALKAAKPDLTIAQ